MAGAGYKLFNTGDVLTAAQVNTYLMEQTVMVFANAAARTTALSGVVSEGMISYLKDTNAVEVYDGSNWVSSDDPNAIQNTIVDAKGDLISASAADTPARLAVGNNGETLVADSSTSTGLRYNPQNALANPIINGGMDIWQRGTSFTPSAGAVTYTTDRWVSYRAVTNYTVTRQTTSDTTNLPNIQYAARLQRTAGDTQTFTLYLNQTVETLNSIPFAGKTVTLSFYARKGANFSEANSYLGTRFYVGTGTDQNVNNGFTNAATPLDTNFLVTTSWQRFAATFTIPTNTTEFAPYFYYAPTGTAGANDWVEITGVQLDLGTYTASSAPTFRRSGGTLAGERSACERYFYRTTFDKHFTLARDANIMWFQFKNPTTMRTDPSISSTLTTKVAGAPANSAEVGFYSNGGFIAGTSAITLNTDSAKPDEVSVYFTGATFTQGTIATAAFNGAYFNVSAEL